MKSLILLKKFSLMYFCLIICSYNAGHKIRPEPFSAALIS
jgi:hypothetical protein